MQDHHPRLQSLTYKLVLSTAFNISKCDEYAKIYSQYITQETEHASLKHI